MARANGDAGLVQDRARVVRVHAVEVERDDARSNARVARTVDASRRARWPAARARSRSPRSRARARCPCRDRPDSRRPRRSAIESATLGVPASNFSGSGAQVARSSKTSRIMPPPPRKGGIASSSSRRPHSPPMPSRAEHLVARKRQEVRRPGSPRRSARAARSARRRRRRWRRRGGPARRSRPGRRSCPARSRHARSPPRACAAISSRAVVVHVDACRRA